MNRLTAVQSILLVEDDLALRQMLSWELIDRGYHVVAVGDVLAAIATAESTAFDVAVVDYQLPDGDGLTLISSLSRAWPKLQFLLISANDIAAELVASEASKRVRFHPKPVNINTLIDSLDSQNRETPE